jgi:hypothetical protein
LNFDFLVRGWPLVSERIGPRGRQPRELSAEASLCSACTWAGILEAPGHRCCAKLAMLALGVAPAQNRGKFERPRRLLGAPRSRPCPHQYLWGPLFRLRGQSPLRCGLAQTSGHGIGRIRLLRTPLHLGYAWRLRSPAECSRIPAQPAFWSLHF